MFSVINREEIKKREKDFLKPVHRLSVRSSETRQRCKVMARKMAVREICVQELSCVRCRGVQKTTWLSSVVSQLM